MITITHQAQNWMQLAGLLPTGDPFTEHIIERAAATRGEKGARYLLTLPIPDKVMAARIRGFANLRGYEER